MLRETLQLARQYLLAPSKGAEAAREEKSLAPSLWIYVAFTAGYLLFYWLKPFDFPDKNAPLLREPLGLFFWFKVVLWQPPLELAWIVFLMGLVAWFREGSLPVRLAAGVAWAASPFLLIVAYLQQEPSLLWPSISRPLFAAGSLVWLALFYPLLKKTPKPDWRPLISFMLGINIIGIVLLIPMAAAVFMDSPDMFKAAQIAGGLWILGASMLGLRVLTGLRLPRAFMAVLLSMLFQAALALTLFALGLVPKEILKALFYG